jgi:hypothetical protein
MIRFFGPAVLLIGATGMRVYSDEGMWLLNEPPRELLKAKYGFDITDAWLRRAQLASVRFNSGGSGGFVSPNGLVVTNHHIAADALQKLSSPGKDYYRDGYLAHTPDHELKCPDLELNVLQEIVDVTDRVNAAVTPGMDPAAAFAARRRVMGEIEKESLDRTGWRSDVVTLYQGGAYHLYRYKKYTDVRLVMAPEAAIAHFGGDTDNFEFPRYCLDVAFFRVYEDGKPVSTTNYFPWNPRGPSSGELVFVTGHPGTTNRLETVAKLRHRRDVTLPYHLARLRNLEAALSQFSERQPIYRQWSATDLHRVANARKAFSGQYQGLLQASLIAQKLDDEERLLNGDEKGIEPPELKLAQEGRRRIAEAQAALKQFETEWSLFERGDAFASELFTIARHLVRLRTELAKPSSERLREYRDSNLESLKFQLFSPAPIHAELEQTKLAASLTFMAERLGGEHPLVQLVLEGQSPALRAAELIRQTRLRDVAERQRLFADNSLLDQSSDALIRLARRIDGAARELRGRYETEVEEVERQGYAALARWRFLKLGRTVAPDATFTLRLAFGVVKGYEENGQPIPFYTTFGGAFERAKLQEFRDPFDLPKRWHDRRKQLALETPLNFVSTADTIGGNSGSPVINRAGELVGINFDRNRHGLVRNFIYTELQARHIAVHAGGVLEALAKLYDADHLVKELKGETLR